MSQDEVAEKIIELVKINARYTTGIDGFRPSETGSEVLDDKWALNVNLWTLRKDVCNLLKKSKKIK